MRESTIENYFVRQVKKAGGEVRKLVTPGRRNAPDRLVLWPAGRIHFVELKAPRKDARSGQKREHERLRAIGCEVWVLNTHGKVDDYVSYVYNYLQFFK